VGVKLSLARLERIERKENRNWEGTKTRESRGEWAEKWDWSSVFSFFFPHTFHTPVYIQAFILLLTVTIFKLIEYWL
jgi:hypothetical protein